jgi:ABC-type uncharacterized transport system auxiliary subunit
MNRRFVLAVLVLLGGCLSPGAREAQRYFVLDAAAAAMVQARSPRDSVLLVGAAGASSFYDSQGMVYSRAPGTRAYYQHSSWTERPGRRIHDLLLARLEKSGAFRTVAPTGSGVRGSLVLTTRLEELYHDAAVPPGSARIELSAELTDASSGALLARRRFTRFAPAASYDAAGAVQGFRAALGALLDEVVSWVDEAGPSR